jgi:hypothetical protein
MNSILVQIVTPNERKLNEFRINTLFKNRYGLPIASGKNGNARRRESRRADVTLILIFFLTPFIHLSSIHPHKEHHSRRHSTMGARCTKAVARHGLRGVAGGPSMTRGTIGPPAMDEGSSTLVRRVHGWGSSFSRAAGSSRVW